MSRSVLLLVALVAACVPAIADAQNDETRIRLVTPDGVTLRGHFFPGTKKSACVLLLHDLGEPRHEKEWTRFAELLSKNGFAVLRLHLRGHGQSTEVDPDVFWSPQYPVNRKLVRSKSKDEIDFQTFDAGYHQYLITDIAHAKAFFDRKNDAGECNSANLVLVCPGRSGALAAAWINSEMNRYRVLPPPFVGAPTQLAGEPEGSNILCALFINLSPDVGKRKLSVKTALQAASRRYRLPAVFFCGSDDKVGKSIAKETEKAINPGGKIPFTGITEIDDADAEDVENRVVTDKDLQKDVLRYLKDVQEDRGKDWEERDWRDTVYYWRNPYAPASLIQFNQTGNNNPGLAGYELFLPRR